MTIVRGTDVLANQSVRETDKARKGGPILWQVVAGLYRSPSSHTPDLVYYKGSSAAGCLAIYHLIQSLINGQVVQSVVCLTPSDDGSMRAPVWKPWQQMPRPAPCCSIARALDELTRSSRTVLFRVRLSHEQASCAMESDEPTTTCIVSRCGVVARYHPS
jgi:hypothetical protein